MKNENNEHLLVEAQLAFEAKGHMGPPSKPQFFKASSLLELLTVAPNYHIYLTGDVVWLS